LRQLIFLLAWLVAGAYPSGAETVVTAVPDTVPVPPVRRELPRHQDSLRLSRLTSGVMPPDGLVTVGLGIRNWTTVYLVNDGEADQLERVSMRDYYLLVEMSPWRWLQVNAEVPWRTWSDGKGWIPESGSGLGDGRWQLATGRTLPGGKLSATIFGGGNLPVGDTAAGLGEGVLSPTAGAALTLRLWTHAQVPEMRLHLNWSRTWNKREDLGYGMGTTLLEPWPPRYQSAAAAGGDKQNDADTWGAALEFRRHTTSLWVEYAHDSFRGNTTVSSSEELATLAMGLRWGVLEGWGLEGGYLLSLADDDENTEWWPAYPDWQMRLAVTRQFSSGGRDRDDDGIVDRKDHCPDTPEDHDGFQDDDGCPEYDNDHDGIPDRHDGAPDAAEDFDGFEDGDGIPDPDNDHDGIPDLRDLCPDLPEVMDGHHDADGCPDELQDRDGDSVEDARDGCPDEPEDFDGFEDDDGCPEADNDLDGIEDEQDQCPDQAEDYDGDEDQDGCPE